MGTTASGRETARPAPETRHWHGPDVNSAGGSGSRRSGSGSTSSAGDLTGEGAPDGTFEAEVSGDAQAALRGPAAFAVLVEDDETISAIRLSNEADDQDGVFLALAGPATEKTYEVRDETARVVLLLHGSGGEESVYLATSGTLTVTRAGEDDLVGRFDVEATSPEGGEVRLEGSFRAASGDVTFPGGIEPPALSGGLALPAGPQTTGPRG